MDVTDTSRPAGRRRWSGVSGDAVVIACQRHPWIASITLSTAVGGAATASILGAPRRTTSHDVLALLPVVAASFAAIGHIGRGARATTDRLAPWFATNAVALAAAIVLSSASGWRGSLAAPLVVALVIAVWPLASAALLPGSPPGDETPVAAVVFPATIVAFPPLMALLLTSRTPEFAADVWTFAMMFCVPVVPLAVHALVRSRVSTPVLVGISLACGFAWELLQPSRSAPGPVTRLLAPSAALAVGLIVAAARRARCLTAVPLDHTIVQDFGGR